MSIKYYKPSHTMCCVTGHTVVIQNRGNIHITVLRLSAFFHLGVATGQTDFWLFCVIKGEERKD